MRIAIAGLGVAGTSLAVRLARDGHAVTVYEQAPEPGPVGAGFLLQPSGQEALAELGILEAIRDQAHAIRAYRAFRAPGRPLIELRYDRADPTAHALGVARGVVFEALLGAALEAGVRVVPGCRISGFREEAEGVEPLDAPGEPVGRFDLLVGADGAWSAIREQLNPGAPLRVSSHGVVWGLGTTDADCPHELRQEARGTTTLVGLLPVGRRTQAFFFGARVAEFDRLVADGFEAMAAEAARVFPATAPVTASIGSFEPMAFGRFGSARARRRHRGRVVLIGDGGHASPPHLGQGANLALLDSRALADALRSTPDDVGAALARFNAERRWQSLRYATLGRALAPFFQSDLPILGVGRDIALPIMARIRPIRWLMEQVLAGRG